MAALWELFVAVTGDNSGFKKTMKDSGNDAETFASKWEAIDKRLALSVGFATVAGGAVVAAKKFEDAGITIQRATGATGEKLAQLEDAFKNVYTQTAKSSEEVSSALSLISTRTGTTGKALEDLTLASLKLANVHKEDVATVVKDTTQLFGAWSVATNQQTDAINYLRVASQQTGAPITKLTDLAASQAPVMKALGFSWQQTVALIGSLDKQGADTGRILSGMNVVLKTFAKEGVTDTAAAWRGMVRDVEAGKTTFDDFLSKYGGKSGTYLFQAIKDGKVDTDSLVKSFQDLEQQGGSTAKTMKDQITIWTHNLEGLVSAHKDLITAVGMLGASGLVTGTFKAFAWAAPGTVAAIGNIATAITSGLVPALTAVETAMLGGGIAALLALLGYGGYKLGSAWQNLADKNNGGNKPWNPSSAYQFDPYTRTGVLRSGPPQSGIMNSAIDYLSNAPAKAPAAGSGNATYGGGLTPGAMSDKFSVTGLKKASDELQVLIDREGQAVAAHQRTIEAIAKSGLTIDQYWKKQKEDAAASVDAFDKLWKETPPQIDVFTGKLADVNAGMDVLKTITDQDTEAMQKMLSASPFGQMAQALDYFGIKSTETLQKTSEDAEKWYKVILDSEKSTDAQKLEAFVATERAKIELQRATGKITQEDYNDLKKQLDEITKGANQTAVHVKSMAQQMADSIHNMFDGIERGIANDIVEWKGFAQTIKDIFKTLAKDTLEILLKQLFAPVEKALAGLIGNAGSAAGSVAGGATSSGAGIAGAASIGASGIMGVIGAVGSAVTAVSSIVGNFQMAKQETTLNAIEHNTRYLQIQFEQYKQDDEWNRWSGWYQRTSDIWQSILDVKDVLIRGISTTGGSGSKSAISFTNCTFSGVDENAIAAAIFEKASLAGVL